MGKIKPNILPKYLCSVKTNSIKIKQIKIDPIVLKNDIEILFLYSKKNLYFSCIYMTDGRNSKYIKMAITNDASSSKRLDK